MSPSPSGKGMRFLISHTRVRILQGILCRYGEIGYHASLIRRYFLFESGCLYYSLIANEKVSFDDTIQTGPAGR